MNLVYLESSVSVWDSVIMTIERILEEYPQRSEEKRVRLWPNRNLMLISWQKNKRREDSQIKRLVLQIQISQKWKVSIEINFDQKSQ